MARLVDLELFLKHQTERAVLVCEDETTEGVWLPLSQVEVHGDVGDVAEVTMPEWLAEERGLI